MLCCDTCYLVMRHHIFGRNSAKSPNFLGNAQKVLMNGNKKGDFIPCVKYCHTKATIKLD